MNSTQFVSISVPRPVFVEAGRGFLGMAYSDVTTGSSTNCSGLILLTLRAVGLLPADFDVNLSELDGAQKARFLWRMVNENCDDIGFTGLMLKGDPVDELAPGDLMFSCWSDVDPSLTDVHHVNIYTGAKPGHYGGFLQCVSRQHGGSGFVCEREMNVLDWQRIERVFRIRALVDGGDS